MPSFVIACLSCMYLLIFAPLILRSISQLQHQRVVFFTLREGTVQARQLTGRDATGYASIQLAGRTLLLGSVVIALLQANLNLLILGTLAGLALGTIANAYYNPRAQVITPEDGSFGDSFVLRRFVITRDINDITDDIHRLDDDDYAIRRAGRRLARDLPNEMPDVMIEDVEYRPVEPPHRDDDHGEGGSPKDQSDQS